LNLHCGKFKCGHRRKIATILTKSIRQHTRHALSFLLVLLTEVMVYINTPSGRIQEQNRYQFLKQALVCTLHPPIQASVDRCGNITSQRVAITGEITNFECHLGTFMITLKILDFTATHCPMIFVEVWTCRNFFVNLYHLMLK